MLSSLVQRLISAAPVSGCSVCNALRACTARKITVGIIMGMALILGGCNTYSGFAGADWPMPYDPTTTLASNDKSVTLTVEDRRPYIVSGEKAPTFIGIVRAGFGNPWNTTFEPAEPVDQKIKRDIIAEVSAQGYDIGQGDYAMDVVIREFTHDGYRKYTIRHNLEVTVAHDASNAQQQSKTSESVGLNRPALGANFWRITTTQ